MYMYATMYNMVQSEQFILELNGITLQYLLYSYTNKKSCQKNEAHRVAAINSSITFNFCSFL